jgi:uncharacterized protein YjiS (DUF1127 family)
MALLQFTAHRRTTPEFAHSLPAITGKPVAAAATLVRTWMKRHAERDELARLTDRELRDIGWSLADIYTEIRKPFWRA